MYDMRPDPESRRAVANVIRCAGGGRVCEVGSYRGQSAAAMLETGIVDRLFCVDPWLPGYDDADLASHDMKGVEADFDLRVGSDPRVVKCKGVLLDFADRLSSEAIDVVYLDANHQYEPCKSDLLVIRDRIKPKVVAGHDYHRHHPRVWPGVRQAVDELFGQPDARFPDSSWLVFLR